MDIIIGSLYSNRDIFLRELISNAADALDKIRFESLTKKDILGQGELDIKIEADKEAGTLTITDRGIGMTRDDLVNNLGTIAKSGTTEFLEAAQAGGDTLSLIGQFGVGFYSVYLVADKVTVVSKNPNDDQHIWQSKADKTFSIAKDPRGNTLGKHGTSITLQLKEDAQEFLQEEALAKLVEKYSQFINFPMYLKEKKTVTREVPDEPEVSEPEDKGADDLEVTDEDEEKSGPKTKTIHETVDEWKRLNHVKAIWVRAQDDIEESEYTEFYKALSKDTKDPLDYLHFVAEGEITFRALLFIPSKAPAGLYESLHLKRSGLKLYVRRVFISDEFDEFLPSYLNFIKGVVDSDDLPLNVSRETLAQSRILKVMGGKITRKVLEMFKRLSDESEEADKEGEKEEDKQTAESGAKGKVDKYAQFWEEFGLSVKLGVIQDKKNKAKLQKLLRFTTSKSGDKQISLQKYVDGMKEGQNKIYYITGESLQAVKNSPNIERLVKEGYEVLYLADAIDEYLLQAMTDFEGVDFQSAGKKGLFDKDKKLKEVYTKEFEDLLAYLGKNLPIEKAEISTRLVGSPCSLVTAQYGWSGNMERIMQAQALADKTQFQYQSAKKTLEINPRHPIILALKAGIAADPSSQNLKDTTQLLYDNAMLADGFLMNKPEDFAKIINRVTAVSLGVDPDAALLDEEQFEETDEEAEEVEEADAE